MAVKKAKAEDVTVEIPNVEVDLVEEVETKEKVETPKIEVDTTPIDETIQAVAKTVRVRMKDDHRMWIGSELYELKKGQCYNVPNDIKLKLNKAGVLSPL